MKIKKDYEIYSLLDLPFLETRQEHLEPIFQTLERIFQLRKNSRQRFVDLGSGDGRCVIYAGLYYGIRSVGYELNPNLIKESKELIKVLKKKGFYRNRDFRNIQIKMGDLFNQNIKNFNYIYIYPLPSMQKFLNHVFITAKNGAIIISYKYPLKNFENYLKLHHILKDNDNMSEISYFYQKF